MTLDEVDGWLEERELNMHVLRGYEICVMLHPVEDPPCFVSGVGASFAGALAMAMKKWDEPEITEEILEFPAPSDEGAN